MFTPSLAEQLSSWAVGLAPTEDDLALADDALVDTVAVALAAHDHPIGAVTAPLTDAGRWSTLAHVLDYDDVHMGSTSHVSAVCVPAVLATGGDAGSYLAGAGVMARLGQVLGWGHYVRGWHATCTAGAPAAAVAAAVAMGLDADQVVHAMLLAIPAAGGVQSTFGTQGKALQVGFAVEAGLRAADLAAAGARSSPAVLEQWVGLLGGDVGALDLTGPAVPGGLAVKLAPCCYALQRPIHAARLLREQGVAVDRIVDLDVAAPAGTVQPLIHRRPETGLQAKFSLEYAVAATLIESYPGFATFSDPAVRRPEVRRLVQLVHFTPDGEGDGLLSGRTRITARLDDGSTAVGEASLPPGAPGMRPTPVQLRAKLQACRPDLVADLDGLSWPSAGALLSAGLSPVRSAAYGR